MTYPIGSKVWGDRGIRCEVLKIQRNKKTGAIRYQVRCPQGNRFVSSDDIHGYERPPHEPRFCLNERIYDKRFHSGSPKQIVAIENSCYRVRCSDKHLGGTWHTWIEFEFATVEKPS